ncbi:MAG: hypothetical protein QXJ59_00580 [Thermofilaceae archaeon]
MKAYVVEYKNGKIVEKYDYPADTLHVDLYIKKEECLKGFKVKLDVSTAEGLDVLLSMTEDAAKLELWSLGEWIETFITKALEILKPSNPNITTELSYDFNSNGFILRIWIEQPQAARDEQ